MSHTLISRNADLRQLMVDGYAVTIRSGFLVLEDIWYVDRHGVVRNGTLVSNLDMDGDRTKRPGNHQVYFAGDVPHRKHGGSLEAGILHNSDARTLAPGLQIQHEFSNKPPQGYANYYEKMKRYVDIINAEARAIDPVQFDARTFRVIPAEEGCEPFEYLDTASTRAGISAAMARFAKQRIAIVGLGGTGAYILDLIAKTPVAEIHLFDGDRFHQHNAFRSPGAAGIDVWPEKQLSPHKVDYYAERYSVMKRRIIAHPYLITPENVNELANFDYVFVCVDRGAARRLIIESLTQNDRTFIDVGINVRRAHNPDQFLGNCRVTAGTPGAYEHIGSHVPMSDDEAENIYSENIQIAELNAFNAVHAVIKWKVMSGFYAGDESGMSSSFSTNFNEIMNAAVCE